MMKMVKNCANYVCPGNITNIMEATQKQIAKFVFLEGILTFLLGVWTAILVHMQILVILVHAIHVLQVSQVPLLQVFATSALQVTLHTDPKTFVKCVK